MPEGCAYLIRARACFRNWAASTRSSSCSPMNSTCPGGSGFPAIRPWPCPSAKLHHRGAAQVNPAGGGATVEFRTSDTKRFYANRNGLLVLLKNAQHLLLLLVPLQLGLLAIEALAGLGTGAALELCEAGLLGRPGGLLAAARTHPGRAPADPAVPPPGRSVDAALPALAIEPLGRTPALAPVRCAEGNGFLKR